MTQIPALISSQPDAYYHALVIMEVHGSESIDDYGN